MIVNYVSVVPCIDGNPLSLIIFISWVLSIFCFFKIYIIISYNKMLKKSFVKYIALILNLKVCFVIRVNWSIFFVKDDVQTLNNPYNMINAHSYLQSISDIIIINIIS